MKPLIPPNQPITFNRRQVTKYDKIATSFCKQFTTIVLHTSDPAARCVKRQLLRDHSIDHTLSIFTKEKVVKAIKQSNNSIAAGPDRLLTVLFLKHLGPRGHEFFTHLFNLSLKSGDIHSICKPAAFIPIPKAVKQCHFETSYRPISLLCPSTNVLERLLRTPKTDSAS